MSGITAERLRRLEAVLESCVSLVDACERAGINRVHLYSTAYAGDPIARRILERAEQRRHTPPPPTRVTLPVDAWDRAVERGARLPQAKRRPRMKP